jgi:hypothetical protein
MLVPVFSAANVDNQYPRHKTRQIMNMLILACKLAISGCRLADFDIFTNIASWIFMA